MNRSWFQLSEKAPKNQTGLDLKALLMTVKDVFDFIFKGIINLYRGQRQRV
jgi:hypothetical protein